MIQIKNYFLLFIGIILFSCDYDQEKFNINVSTDKSTYLLKDNSGQFSNNVINIEINGGMSKGVISPIIAKYDDNDNIISYNYLYNYNYLDECCDEDHPDVNSVAFNGMICLCDVDLLSSSISIDEFLSVDYSFDVMFRYKVIIVDPYIQNGIRVNDPIYNGSAPDQYNIIAESDYFSFTDEYNITPCEKIDCSSLSQLSANLLYNTSPNAPNQFSVTSYGFNGGPVFYGSGNGGYLEFNVNLQEDAKMRFWYKVSNPGFWTFNPPPVIINGVNYNFDITVPISAENNYFLQAESNFILSTGNYTIRFDLGPPGGNAVGFFIDDIDFICQ